MENEIKKLLDKYRNHEWKSHTVFYHIVIRDLESLCGRLLKRRLSKMAKEHVLKCWPQYFEAILFDQKTFEVRYNDRRYERGDMLVLREYNNDTKEYTGRQIRVEVTDVFNDFGLQPDWIAMSFKKCKCCRSLF